tara:strand:- start:1206 stop:2195 length:990 start_codon:yes stop_codon:yes gene_type:complete
MSKKIVVVPIFCESHMVKCQIPNIIDTINPDYIIYREGVFPKGPENNTDIDFKWLDKYTLDGRRGFDFLEMKKIIDDAQKKYPNTKIILDEIDYKSNLSAPECYMYACSELEELGIKLEEGDFIFPFEGDVFHHENSQDDIKNYLEQLEPDTGFRSFWIDYVFNFWYVTKYRIKPFLKDKKHHYEQNYQSRRICVRFGTMKFYKEVLLNFMTREYKMLYPTDLITYHYANIRPNKFAELRADQLVRDFNYWKGQENARIEANQYLKSEINVYPHLDPKFTGNWIKFFDIIDHPKHIRNHDMWTNISSEVSDKLRGDDYIVDVNNIKVID